MLPQFAIVAVLALMPQTDPIHSPITLEDRVFMSYADLLEPAAYSHEEFKVLRSKIEHERDDKLDASRKTEKQWKSKLEEVRSELHKINRGSSVDTPGIRERREQIHVDIAALERGIQEKVRERDVTIPVQYNKQLAKLGLIENWPERFDSIHQRIELRQSRERRHGDVEDIGYRHIAKDSGKDLEVGSQASQQLLGGGWLPAPLQDAEVQGYVRQLANRLAVNSDLKVPLHVTVLDSGDLKVTALPGGFLYVTSGVLLAAHTESEFAGVVSRQIARIAARHVTRASTRSFVSKIFLPIAEITTGVFSGGMNRGAYYGIGYGIQGLNGLVNKASDDASGKYQREADQLGAQYAWKAGFDPKGGLEFLDSLRGDVASETLSDEHVFQKRLLDLFSEIEYLPPLPNAIVDSSEFHAARERLRRR